MQHCFLNAMLYNCTVVGTFTHRLPFAFTLSSRKLGTHTLLFYVRGGLRWTA